VGARFSAPVQAGPWGPPSLLYNGYWVFPGGKEHPGRDTDPSPPFRAVSHERVELYLYSPYGPYSLYRVSVPVQGVHFTLLMDVYVYPHFSCFCLLPCNGLAPPTISYDHFNSERARQPNLAEPTRELQRGDN
jgi:hypothetical protein